MKETQSHEPKGCKESNIVINWYKNQYKEFIVLILLLGTFWTMKPVDRGEAFLMQDLSFNNGILLQEEFLRDLYLALEKTELCFVVVVQLIFIFFYVFIFWYH